jgi:hypothetical protein
VRGERASGDFPEHREPVAEVDGKLRRSTRAPLRLRAGPRLIRTHRSPPSSPWS